MSPFLSVWGISEILYLRDPDEVELYWDRLQKDRGRISEPETTVWYGDGGGQEFVSKLTAAELQEYEWEARPKHRGRSAEHEAPLFKAQPSSLALFRLRRAWAVTSNEGIGGMFAGPGCVTWRLDSS